jgi:hypothetical protein
VLAANWQFGAPREPCEATLWARPELADGATVVTPVAQVPGPASLFLMAPAPLAVLQRRARRVAYK